MAPPTLDERGGYQYRLHPLETERRNEREEAGQWSGFRSPVTQTINLASLFMNVAYISALTNHAITVNRTSPVIISLNWLTVFAETSLWMHDLLAVPLELLLFTLSGDRDKTKRPCSVLIGTTVPVVDVFVACCGESVQVIMNTVTAVAKQDYPTTSYQVYVLDDGCDAELKAKIETFNAVKTGKKKVLVTYLTRNNRPLHYKAGNLNFGLQQSARLGGKGHFFGCVDADMIVQPDWLRRMLPHLTCDPDVAVACGPQDFYNLPRYDPLCQSDLDPDENIPELLRDGLGTARCSGSGFVARRCAVDQIRGFPVNSLTEDLMLTAKLHGASWKTAYVAQRMQCGLAPESIKAYIKQVMRWTTGDIQVARSLNWFLPGMQETTRLTVRQRLSYFLSSISRCHSFATCAALLMLPIGVLHGQVYTVTPDASDSSFQLLRLLRLGNYATTKLTEICLYKHAGLSGIAKAKTSRVWMSPYTMVAIVKAYIPKKATFQSTGSVTSSTNERSATNRKHLAYRIFHSNIKWFAVYVMLTAAAALVFLFRLTTMVRNTPNSSLVPFTGTVTRLAECLFMCWTPVQYMINPPTSVDRQLLLDKDDTSVDRPIGEVRMAEVGSIPWTDVIEVSVIYYFDWSNSIHSMVRAVLTFSFVLFITWNKCYIKLQRISQSKM